MRGVKGSTPGHGTTARYKAGCPCRPCRTVAYRKEVRYEMDVLSGVAKQVPGTGTTRRLQALAAIGWDAHDVAGSLGRTHQWVSLLRRRGDRPVFTATAEAVRSVYDQLSMTPGGSDVARRLAARENWPPPLAWDDIDDTNVTPDLGTATAGFDLDEWARLVRWGEQPDRAAERCGVTLATVEKATYRKDRPDIRALTRRAVA